MKNKVISIAQFSYFASNVIGKYIQCKPTKKCPKPNEKPIKKKDLLLLSDNNSLKRIIKPRINIGIKNVLGNANDDKQPAKKSEKYLFKMYNNFFNFSCIGLYYIKLHILLFIFNYFPSFRYPLSQ